MRHLSLFSGIGGIDLAAEWAGFTTVAFCEKDEYCQKVLKKHWPDVPIIEDVHDVNRDTISGSIELISGGFPCQPFSHAGKRRGTADDRHLWPEMLRIIQEFKPTWVLGENVAGFKDLGLDIALSDLESIGYAVQTFDIPACAVDAPHRRDRVWIVANSISTGRSWRKGCLETDRCNLREEIQTQFRTSKNLADSNNAGHIKQRWTKSIQSEFITTECGNRWIPEPDVGRVADGIPARVDRLRCLGNAVVPQQVYPILQAIADVEAV